MGTGYDILVTLHLLCVVGGFGYLAYSGLTLAVGRRRGAALGTLEVTQQVSSLAELLIYAAFLFGIAAVGSSRHVYNFGQTWVVLALILYVAAIGVLHGLIRPARKEYATLATKLSETKGPIVGTPPEVRRIESLEKRIALGWGMFNVVVVAVIALMVFQPGSPGA